MTTETINGLHSCKPGNEPIVGQVKTFTVEQKTSKTGKPWLKIKSAGPDYGGEPYRILSAKPTGFTDARGNISFNIEVERDFEGGGGENTQKPVQAASSPPQNSKDDYWERKLQHEMKVQPMIVRQHSQSMALEVLKLKVTLNELTVEDLTPAKLRQLADYFDQDVLNATCP